MDITYRQLTIRDALPTDAAQLCVWWNDGAVMAHAGFPNGLGVTEEQIIARLSETGSKHFRHIIEYQSKPIGEMNYREQSAGVCEIGIKICDASMQNKGLGKVILSLFIDALFHRCGYQKILLDTNLTNLRAQHVYEQLGFRKLRVNINSWTDQLGCAQSSVDYELVPADFVSFLSQN